MWCGLLLLTIFVSLAFYNEQRSDYSILARSATIVSPLAIPSQVQGEIVAVTGTISTPELVGDNLLLKPTASTVLVRTVEMFSWHESATTKSKNRLVVRARMIPSTLIAPNGLTVLQTPVNLNERIMSTHPKQYPIEYLPLLLLGLVSTT